MQPMSVHARSRIRSIRQLHPEELRVPFLGGSPFTCFHLPALSVNYGKLQSSALRIVLWIVHYA